jgi:glycosyltransferase involved in cell wall biosynthesis
MPRRSTSALRHFLGSNDGAASVMRLAIVCQSEDPEDPLLGSFADWARELAGRVEALTVHTPNSWAVRGPWRRARELSRRLASDPVDAIFAHMCPEYAIACAPFARRNRIPIILWYAHGATSLRLRVAAALTHTVVTSSPEGFRLRRPCMVIGQGINTDRFHPGRDRAGTIPNRLLSVGRLSPVKRYEDVLAAVARLVHVEGMHDLELDIAGGPARPGDGRYVESLRQRSRALGIEDRVRWLGPVPHTAMPDVYARCAVFISASDTGSLDRAALEAMACGKPVVTTNPAFASWVGPAPSLERELMALLQLSDAARSAQGLRLRERVVREHGIEQWGGRLHQVLQDAAA